MTRVIYNNPAYSTSQVNVGYQLSNKRNYWDFTVDLKARTNHCKGIRHSFDCFTVTGKALNEYEE